MSAKNDMQEMITKKSVESMVLILNLYLFSLPSQVPFHALTQSK